MAMFLCFALCLSALSLCAFAENPSDEEVLFTDQFPTEDAIQDRDIGEKTEGVRWPVVNETDNDKMESVIYVNPLYKKVVSSQQLERFTKIAEQIAAVKKPETSDPVYETSREVVVQQLREGLKARELDIDLYYKLPVDEELDFIVFSKELFEDAIVHTGVSTEGDYLRFQYCIWQASSSIKNEDGYSKYRITYILSYYTDAAQETAVDAAIGPVLQSLKLDDQSDYEKIRRIFAYICDNVTYDYEHLPDGDYDLKYTAYAALIDHTAVCQGYSVLFYRMLLEAGVDARVIAGYANGNPNAGHAWNIVQFHGFYYNMDSTWDAGNSPFSWFLRGASDFPEHTRYPEYQTETFYDAYPMSEDAYDTSLEPLTLWIMKHPKDYTGEVGETAFFSVRAEGDGLNYQWQYRTTTSGWLNSSSATTGYNTSTLQVVGTEARNGFHYRCVVKDRDGNTMTSNAATLTVSTGPKITIQPSNQIVSESETATFNVEATGRGLIYQWQYKTTTSTWRNSSSATTGYNTATLKVVGTAARNGFQYRCIVKDSSGKSVTSNAATLTVSTGPKITTQPSNQMVSEGTTATFKVIATGTGLTYRWQYKTLTSGWLNSSSATTGYNTATLKVVGSAARNGFQYRCIVKDSNGKSVTSDAVTLNVKTDLKIITQPVDCTVDAIGDTATFKVVAEGDSLTYQWWIKNLDSTAFTKSKIKKATYSTTVTESSNGRQLYCDITDKYGNSVQTNTVTMTVDDGPQIIESGYLYLDSLEFSVSANPSISNPTDISAQAKALVYFPTEAGNITPDVVALSIDIPTWSVAISCANNGYLAANGAPDEYVTSEKIVLPTMTTTSFCDTNGRVVSQLNDVRVYDRTFDGWYCYDMYQNGTYALKPVGTEMVTTRQGEANTDYTKNGINYPLSSSTADCKYTMDLGTMTARIATVTGYKNIQAGQHGGTAPFHDPVSGQATVPFIGRVGGNIEVNQNQTIQIIDEFEIAPPAVTLQYAVYKGEAGFFAAENQYRLKFLGAGVANYLFATAKVNFNGTEINVEDLRAILKKDGSECYALSLDTNNYIVAIRSIMLSTGTASGFDVDGQVLIDQVSYNLDSSQVWNYINGKAETIAIGDTVYYADPDGDGTIDILWLTHPGEAVNDPNWHMLSAEAPWVWWTP